MKKKYLLIIILFINICAYSQNFNMRNSKIDEEQAYLIYIKSELESGNMITTDENGVTTTLLIQAIKRNYLSSVEYIFSQNPYKKIIDEPCDQYAPPLFWAIQKGSKDIAELLLRNGANPDFETANGLNAYEVIDNCLENKEISELKANELKQLFVDYGYQLEEQNNIKIDDKLKVKENLKLRTVQGTGTIITTISTGSSVKVKLLGKYENIDYLNSRWFYVEVLKNAKDKDGNPIKAGTVGWCYGGYLE